MTATMLMTADAQALAARSFSLDPMDLAHLASDPLDLAWLASGPLVEAQPAMAGCLFEDEDEDDAAK